MSKFDVATEMNSIMASPGYQSIFSKSEIQFNKTAAKKVDDKEKAKAQAEKEKEKAAKEKEKEKAAKLKEKEKAEKEKAKAKADKEKAKAKKKATTKYEECVNSLCTASEILDQAGLGKASALALLALDNLIKTAAKKMEDKGKSKEDKEKEKAKAAKEKEKAKAVKEKEKEKAAKEKAKEKAQKDKKVKKASDDCGDMGMVEDNDDNKDFEALMQELNEPSEDGDWEILNEPAEKEDIDIDDPEIESLVEGLDEPKKDDDIDLSMIASDKRTSLQRLAEELGHNFLA